MGESGRRANRRSHKRYRRRLKVRYWWDDLEGTGFTADISNGGLMLETTRSLGVGTRLHLEIETDQSSYFVEGVVVRKKRAPEYARAVFKSGVGIRFVALTEAIRAVAGACAPDTTSTAAPDTAAGRDAAVAGQQPAHVPMEVDLREVETLKATYESDIRHGGLRLVTTEIPELSSEVVVPIHLPAPHGSIDCRGEVVKVFEDPPGFAMRLSEIDAVRARIVEILRSS